MVDALTSKVLFATPTPPVVLSNCNEVLTPVLFNVSQKNGCEGDRAYTFRYTDCEGNTADWSFIYHVEYLPFTVPPSALRLTKGTRL